MEWYFAISVLMGGIVGLMLIGLPVAFAFLVVNSIGILIFTRDLQGLNQILLNSSDLLTTFTLAPMPLFVFMGALFFHSGLAIRVFDAIDKLFGGLPGRLCYMTVAGGSLFSTLTGSSMANTAMLGSLMVPEMQRRGYSRQMSMGPILGTGGLAMIIPPSSLAVLLAAIAGIDLGRLLVAGLAPGFVLAALYVGMIYLQVRLLPDGAPGYEVESSTVLDKLTAVAINLVPMGCIIFMVVGFIVFGIATPTESAAFGVLGVIALGVAMGQLNWQVLSRSIMATVQVGGMLFFILMNSTVFSQLLAYSGASSGLINWATGFDLSPYAVLAVMLLVLIVLGMFMDPMSMIMISTPLFFPLAVQLGFDPIWFAIVVLITLEMSLTTPPFGLLLFVMLGVAPKGTTLFQVSLAAAPFLFCDALLILLLFMFPMIALYIPGLM